MITSERLAGSENYLSWSASMELWFMGQGYEDHIVTQEVDVPEVDRVQWRKIDVQLCSVLWQSVDPKILLHLRAYKTCFKFWNQAKGLYTMISNIFISSSVPSLDDVFARLLRISSTQTLPSDNTSDSSMLVSQTNSRGGLSGNRGRGQRPHCTYCNKLGHTRDRCYQLHGRPPRIAHMAQSSNPQLPQPPSSSTSQGISLTDSKYDDYLRYQATKSAFVTSVAQTGNASTCLTHTSSLGPWILDSGASDHISGNKDLFSSITTTSALPTVTLANGSQTMAKGPEYGEDDWHRTRLGHPSLSKFQKMVPRFSSLSSLACESCQLGKHTRVSFPKRLNNRAKSPFELVHTDVWGPCRTASTLGFQYFVTFIDDYSRCTCDNAREYFSAPFTSFMSQHGIIHQSSCAHTPQQNGVVNVRIDILLRQLVLSFSIDKLSAKPQNASSWDIPDFKRVIVVIPLRLIATFSPLMSLSLRTHHSSPPLSLFLFLKSYPFPLSPHLMQCLLAHFRFIIASSCRVPPSLAEVPADSLPIPSASPAPALPPSADLPIALRKGNRSTRNPHPIYNFLSYHRLSSPYSAFVSAISSVSLPKSTPEALSHPGWRQAMVDEMAALHSNGTWDLVVLPSGKSTVGCRWVYTVKVGPDGQVDRLKARLVAKGYTQVYGSDYGDTFSPVAKIASVRLLLSMAAMRSWPLYQLRRSLYGLKQSPRAWFSRFSSVVQEFGMFRSTADHSVFYHHNSSGQCIYLVVYVDDIVITGSDQNGIQKLKQHLFTHFQTKDLGKLKYFLGIEIAQSSSGVVLSQRKYALDILEETGEPLGDPGRYRRLVGKLNYLTITRPDISFPVSVVSQFLQSPCDSHWDAVIRILRYIKSTPGQGVLYENRGHTQSKKQDVVARSSAEAEYRAMALATCELIWLKHLLRELRFGKDEQMKLICDNQAALHIASNPVFHERTKHIEVDCHFIREKIASGCVATSFVNSNDQLADIFTKSLRVLELNTFVTSLVHITYMLQLEGEC
ncbi:Retrovirus-related Pol polyprotein from transposon RE1 [Vitis vinifera]|uniref:Retrovirus-related Pol polyprotein from transposon RE1 n=1 Tax=Vitis vinifera TaxID=29760 RepID=A0A438D033_VITVI|nr:Retrovirus-related Pol polyprotein from transposon RE1 [Vitis vinifera]